MIANELIVDDSMSFVPEAIEALRRFKALKTSAANRDARLEAMQMLINELVEAYGLNIFIRLFTDPKAAESFEPMTEEGVLICPLLLCSQNLSIITLLHQFAAIRYCITGENPGTAIQRQRFAVNLFRKVYPEQFAKLVMDPLTGFFVRRKPEGSIAG